MTFRKTFRHLESGNDCHLNPQEKNILQHGCKQLRCGKKTYRRGTAILITFHLQGDLVMTKRCSITNIWHGYSQEKDKVKAFIIDTTSSFSCSCFAKMYHLINKHGSYYFSHNYLLCISRNGGCYHFI